MIPKSRHFSRVESLFVYLDQAKHHRAFSKTRRPSQTKRNPTNILQTPIKSHIAPLHLNTHNSFSPPHQSTKQSQQQLQTTTLYTHWYTLSRFGPPHTSPGAPEQAMAQSVSATRVLVTSRALPQ